MSEFRPEIKLGSRIKLRSLSMRANGNEWILGSVATGEFIAVPAVAIRIVKLLEEGLTVGEVESALRAETGHRFAVEDFASALDEAGFISAIDGKERRVLSSPRPSLPWLKPKHVRFLVHPASLALAISFVVGAFVALGFRHQATLGYRTIVWTRYSGLAITVNAAIGWTIIYLHELGHLFMARAAGAPARITLGTRLRFLVAQTDVSGIWTAPRRIRMTVYLSGLCIDLSIAVGCLLVLNYLRPVGVIGQLVALTSIEAFLMLPPQLMVFMRTDLYFVLQDLTRSPNLYADGLAYLRQVAMRFTPGFPDRTLTPRKWVKAYAFAVLIGSAICIATEFTVSIPAVIVIVVNGFREFGKGLAGAADGLAAISAVVVIQVLWVRSWCQRHGRRLLTWWRHNPASAAASASSTARASAGNGPGTVR